MEFPTFLFGTEESVHDRAEAEGARWLDSWRRTGALPEGALRRIEPGELVIVHRGTLDPYTPRWMLPGLEFALLVARREPDREAFEDYIRATPWGALSECVRMRPPNTIATVTRRARNLVSMWERLSTLRYIGAPKRLQAIITYPGLNQSAIGFDELIGELFAGPLAVWGPAIGAPRLRLDHALDAMAAASTEDARARVLARMIAIARDNPRTQSTHAADPAAITAWVAALSSEEWDGLLPGVGSDLIGPLYALLRHRSSSDANPSG